MVIRKCVCVCARARSCACRDKRLRETLQLQGIDLAKLRTARLVRLLRTSGGNEGRAAADVLFEKIIRSGGATWQHYNVMMKAALDSGAARGILQQMVGDGVTPDVSSYNTLIGHLAIEGDYAGVTSVVTEEMPAAGVDPDERTKKVQTLNENALMKRRRSSMAKMLTAGVEGEAAAEALMTRLEKSYTAHSEHYRFIINHFGKQVAAATAANATSAGGPETAASAMFSVDTALINLDHWFERSPFIRRHKLEQIGDQKWKVVLHGASRHLSFARLRALRAEFEAMPEFAAAPASHQQPHQPPAHQQPSDSEDAEVLQPSEAASAPTSTAGSASSLSSSEAATPKVTAGKDAAEGDGSGRSSREGKPGQLFIVVGRGDRSGTGTGDVKWQRTSQASSKNMLKSQVSRWLQKRQIRYRYVKSRNGYEVQLTPANIAKFKRAR